MLLDLEFEHLAQVFLGGQRQREGLAQHAPGREHEGDVALGGRQALKRCQKGLALAGRVKRLQGHAANIAQDAALKPAQQRAGRVQPHQRKAPRSQTRRAQPGRHHAGQFAQPPAQETAGDKLLFQPHQGFAVVFGRCAHQWFC